MSEPNDIHGFWDDGHTANVIVSRDTLYATFTTGGQYQYFCSNGNHYAGSVDLVTSCMWHGEDCIDWYLLVDPDKAQELLENDVHP